jgi:hypothetical protein
VTHQKIIFISLLFLFSSGFAQLTHKQFMKLKPIDQEAYVRDLQDIFVGLSNSSQYFAEFELEKRSIASNRPSDSQIARMRLAEAQDELKKFSEMIAAKKSGKAIDEAELNRMARIVRNDLISAAHHANLLPRQEQEARIKEIKATNQKFEEVYRPNRGLVTSSDSRNWAEQSGLIVRRITSPESPKQTASQVAPQKAAPIVAKPVSQPLCVYAGFVIKGDRCRSEQKLPFVLRGINVETFKCEDPQILCNPFIFGFKSSCAEGNFSECLKDAKPVCTNKIKTATSFCAEQAKDEKYLKRAASLIANNKDAYENFSKDFHGLCDEGKIRDNIHLKQTADGNPRKNYQGLLADTVQTCSIAKKHLALVTERYRTLASSRPASPATSGGK